MINDWSSKRVTVMGLGRFGGGAGVARWLASQGARVLVTDVQPAEKLHDSIREIDDLIASKSVELRLGGHDIADFTPERCDVVIANPAVPKPWNNPFINAAMTAGVHVTTEIRLLIEQINRNRVIGVTGSSGKSTTAAMIHHILCRAGVPSHLGGNIGGSLLNQLDQIHDHAWIVLELSSAMLHWLGEGIEDQRSTRNSDHQSSIVNRPLPWSPHIAVITNITPNHIDWHGSFDHYRESKLNLVRHQQAGDTVVTDDLLDFGLWISDCGTQHRVISQSEIHNPKSKMPLKVPGTHNQLNAQFAIVAARSAVESMANEDRPQSKIQNPKSKIPLDIGSLLQDFPGLPHRLQLVAERDGLRFYSDSKSTTPEATVLAVAAFDDPSRIHLIAGGYDKGSDLTAIAQLSQRIAGLYTIGATGAQLAAAAPPAACRRSAVADGFAHYCETLESAVSLALPRMKPGDILLLSPGCASWDQFTNYEQRGEAFVRLVAASG